MAFPVRRALAYLGGAIIALLALALVALAALPLGWFKPIAEHRLSSAIGAPASIGGLRRRGGISLRPVLDVEDVRIAQPRWAGAGDLLRVDHLTLTLPLLPLLRGRVEPASVEASGVRAALVRAADGRENWRRSGGGGASASIARLTVRDAVVTYRDAVQQREATVTIAADPTHGLIARGSGRVRGAPVSIALVAPPERDGRWPFRAQLDGPALAMTATGTMAAPLDTARMSLDVAAWASDLKMVDAVIEAGLFGTQPVRLSAHVEHDRSRWRVTNLVGTIGASTRVAGHVDVDRKDGRTKLSGAIRATSLDFDDLASGPGLAEAAALRARIGRRLVPDTVINIRHITRTDGVLDVRVDRIVSQEPSALRTLAGRLTIDHQLLDLDPLVIGLTRGAITGRVRVDQQGGAPVPLVRLDLRLTDSSIPAIAGGGGDTITGRFDARAVLTGRGSTVREAVGASSGRIGVVAREGALPAQIADALGFDAGRALFAGSDDRTGLRCAVLGLDVRHGVGRVDPLVIDTAASRTDGSGTVIFPSEALSIRLTGAPKRGSLLRLPGAAYLQGSIEDPHVVVPHEVKSVGNFLRAIGRTITGRQGPTATDADCAALTARLLR